MHRLSTLPPSCHKGLADNSAQCNNKRLEGRTFAGDKSRQRQAVCDKATVPGIWRLHMLEKVFISSVKLYYTRVKLTHPDPVRQALVVLVLV